MSPKILAGGRRFSDVACRDGPAGVTPHRLRRPRILGHSLTLGTCSHVVPETAHEAAESMGEVLWTEPLDTYEDPVAASVAATTAAGEVPPGTSPTLTRPFAVRRQGLEPRTRGLRVRCSAN